MANCCICGKKLGYFEGVLLTLDLSMCDKCKEHKNNLNIESENYNEYAALKSIEFLKECLTNDTVMEGAKSIIENLIEKSASNDAMQIVAEKGILKHDAMKTTTGYNFEGYKIMDYIAIVSDEIAMGTGFLSELSVSINDVLGTSSETYRGKIAKSKEYVLQGLKEKARLMGANAVIGIDFDVMTVGKNMIVVSANGTAVVIEKIGE